MRRWAGLLVAGWAVLPGVAAPARAQPAPPPRVELPIREVDLSDGTRRYVVRIGIGGVMVDAGLDSGSTGLRVLPGILADKPSGPHSSYSYESGTELDGVVAETAVAFGALSGPVPVQRVQAVTCHAGKSNCPARHVSLAQFGVQGDGLPGQGFKAILGINMARDAAPNPLTRLGVRRWIIDLPRPGETGGGRLVLNPTDEEAAGYKTLHIDADFGDRNGGLHDAVHGCITDMKSRRRICGPLVLDTGAPGIQVLSPVEMGPFADGDPARLLFTDAGQAVTGAAFDVGRRDEASRFTVEVEPRAPAPRLFMGILPYFVFSTLYDPQAGTIGLKAR
jgi:hypothetical protein